MAERIPAEVFCLGEHLYDEMIERGWRTAHVAAQMGDAREPVVNLFIIDTILAVQDDSVLIDDATFDALARIFGVSNDYFRNLHATWLKWPDRRSPFEAPDSIFGPYADEGTSPLLANNRKGD